MMVLRSESPNSATTSLAAFILPPNIGALSNLSMHSLNSLPHVMIVTFGAGSAEAMAGYAAGFPNPGNLSSFRVCGNFFSFNPFKALDKLMQSKPESLTRQISSLGPFTPTVMIEDPICLTRFNAACACCDNKSGTLPSMTCVSITPGNFCLGSSNVRAKGIRYDPLVLVIPDSPLNGFPSSDTFTTSYPMTA